MVLQKEEKPGICTNNLRLKINYCKYQKTFSFNKIAKQNPLQLQTYLPPLMPFISAKLEINGLVARVFPTGEMDGVPPPTS